jgi:hypothetical protein
MHQPFNRSITIPAAYIACLFSAALTVGCSPAKQTTAIQPTDPCAELRERDPHCGWKPHWIDTGADVNALDGVQTEFLMLESTDADGRDYGKLHYAILKLCFKNGKLCGGTSMAIAFRVDGWVQSINDETRYKTSVRFRFDSEPLKKEVWTIADNREAFGPPAKKVFLSQLLQHRQIILEFSYDERSALTLTFDLSGLADMMKSAGLSI